MNNKILKSLENSTVQLAFAVLSGLAYFAVVYNLLAGGSEKGGGLIVFFFCPAIVCGAALLMIKQFKQCREDGRESTIISLFWLHAVLIVIAAVITVATIIL